jgi:hypothetical protein
MMPLECVVRVLETVTPQYVDEYDVQQACADALELAGHTAVREHRLTDADRIDILTMIDDAVIGVEVKVAGALRDVIRQLERYSRSPELDALVLVTTRGQHHRIPTELNGMPVRLVSLILGGI